MELLHTVTNIEESLNLCAFLTSVFEQGKQIESIAHLRKRFDEQKRALKKTEIHCPEDWGGIHIKPVRIEFMEFKNSRLHERMLYGAINGTWENCCLS